jgi:anti-anti-sigma regulatory factor
VFSRKGNVAVVKDVNPKQASSTEDRETTIVLEPRLDVSAAGSLKNELSVLLDQPGVVHLDASRVARISTAACQVTVAFVVAMRNLGRTARVVSPSTAYLKAFAALGLTQFVTEEA